MSILVLPNPIARGIPNKGEPVHKLREDGKNVYCGNGSWHIFYQHRIEWVTCEKCLEMYEKERC